jgi:hypothetical protein
VSADHPSGRSQGTHFEASPSQRRAWNALCTAFTTSPSLIGIPPSSPDTSIESWAPARANDVNTEVLEWIASQMRGKRRGNHTLMRMVATIVGAAALPLVQLPNVFDIGM